MPRQLRRVVSRTNLLVSCWAYRTACRLDTPTSFLLSARTRFSFTSLISGRLAPSSQSTQDYGGNITRPPLRILLVASPTMFRAPTLLSWQESVLFPETWACNPITVTGDRVSAGTIVFLKTAWWGQALGWVD